VPYSFFFFFLPAYFYSPDGVSFPLRGKGLHYSSLEEVIAAVPAVHRGKQIFLNIELKHDWKEDAKELIDALVAHLYALPANTEITKRLVVSSQ
jgi:hypothetical protein